MPHTSNWSYFKNGIPLYTSESHFFSAQFFLFLHLVYLTNYQAVINDVLFMPVQRYEIFS